MIKIIEMNIQDIKQYENNPRNNRMAIDTVASSIKEFGFKVPIIVDKDNVIIAGHTRVLAAITLGMEKAPTIIADDLTEEQIKAFRIADNKVAEAAEWDDLLLAEELAELQNIDMTSFGFTENELDDLMNGVPDFAPGTLEEQGDLTKLEPKIVICPHCSKEFDINAKS